MNRSWLRAAPMLLVGALLALAAFGPSRYARARLGPVPDADVSASCDTVIQQADGDATVPLATYAGVTQPVIPETNVLSCSLGVVPPGDNATALVVMVEWDPLRLVPDPTSIALRARSFGICSLTYSPILVGWSPPVVVRRSEHLAEPPRTTVAFDYLNTAALWQIWRYQASGPPEVPVAYYYGPPPLNARTPPAGAHPVLSHVVCGGDSMLQRLSVVQSVVSTNTWLDTTYAELIQRFRVPVETRLHWVELAFGTVAPRSPFVPGDIAILDAQGVDTPPLTPPTPLVSALLKTAVWYVPVWDSHGAFDHVITLEPCRDYWLLVGTTHCYGVYGRTRTGSEGPDFLAGVGPFYTRKTDTDAWSEVPSQTLCFRLIGEPTGSAADVPRDVPTPIGLRLRVTPNPAHSTASVHWSGAVGAVRLEVLDVRGRRVGAGSGLAASAGDWSWRAVRGDGRPLPTGVYFMRAIDSAGRVAVERVVLVR